jgi:hypothetical protein
MNQIKIDHRRPTHELCKNPHAPSKTAVRQKHFLTPMF